MSSDKMPASLRQLQPVEAFKLRIEEQAFSKNSDFGSAII